MAKDPYANGPLWTWDGLAKDVGKGLNTAYRGVMDFGLPSKAATLSPKVEVDDTTIKPRVYDGKTKPRIPGWEDAGKQNYQDIADKGWHTQIDTTQNANTPIVTRSHNEEYVQKKAQWGNNPDVKAAADKGFETGKAYREGDPYDLVPDYINAGSKEYMERADMKVWAEANPEAAAALRAKGERREARHAERTRTQNAMFNPPTDGEGEGLGKEKGLGGLVGDYSAWAADQASNAYDSAEAGMGFKDALSKAQGFDSGMKDVQEGAITNTLDKNPGMTRGQAVKSLEAGNIFGRERSKNDRFVPTSQQVSNEMLDEEAELAGMHRNTGVDMVRTDQPMAHLEMGKPYSVPSMNRASANSPLQRAAGAQAASTGTANSPSMQPRSGLNEAATQKTSLPYEQGNVHTRKDQDMQERSDHISADRFAYEASKQVGKRVFGEDYTPNMEKPLW